MKNGVYAFRFNGFEPTKLGVGYLIGVGVLTLKGDEIVSGAQSSTATLLSKRHPVLLPATFNLTGRFTEKGFGRYDGTIRFKETGKPPKGAQLEVLIGEFKLVHAGGNRYWLISTGTRNITGGGNRAADEVVSGEMVWIKGL